MPLLLRLALLIAILLPGVTELQEVLLTPADELAVNQPNSGAALCSVEQLFA